MDEFDKSIKESNNAIEPSANFVDHTMDKVAELPKIRSGWGFKAWGSVVGGLVAVLAVVFVIVPLTQNSSTKTDLESNVSSAKGVASNPAKQAPSTTATSKASPAPPAGTDDASLSSDLNSVSSSINQENADQSAANNAINDSSQEIAVPTN
jgi:negative regulator of sigma E activity